MAPGASIIAPRTDSSASRFWGGTGAAAGRCGTCATADEPERDLEVGHVPHPAAEVDEVRDAAVPEERRDSVADHSAGEEPGADPRAGDSADSAPRGEAGEGRRDREGDRAHERAPRQL